MRKESTGLIKHIISVTVNLLISIRLDLGQESFGVDLYRRNDIFLLTLTCYNAPYLSVFRRYRFEVCFLHFLNQTNELVENSS